MVTAGEADALLNHTKSNRRRRIFWDDMLSAVSPSIIQAMVAVVQAVSFGSLLLPSDIPAFRSSAARGISAWMRSIVVGQVSILLASRLPCGVAGAAFEIIPFVHAVAYSVVEELRDEDDEIIVVTALAGASIMTWTCAAWYAVVVRLKLHNLLRHFPVSALKGALAGIGVYLLPETWNSVNRDPLQLTVAVLMAIALVTGERLTSSSRFASWFVAVFMFLAGAIIWLLKHEDPSWYLFEPTSASGDQVKVWSDMSLGLRFSSVRWRVLLVNSKLWVSCAGAAFVHQLSTMIDYVNLQALGCRVRRSSRDKVAEPSLLRNARGSAASGTNTAGCDSPSNVAVSLPSFQTKASSAGRQEGQALSKQRATPPLQTTHISLASPLTEQIAAPLTRHTEGAPLVSREFSGAAPACKVIGLRRDKNIVVATAAERKSETVLESELFTIVVENALVACALGVPVYMPFSACYAAHRAYASSKLRRRQPVTVEPLALANMITFVVAAERVGSIAPLAARPVVACYFLWLAWIFVDETVVRAAFLEKPHPLDAFVIYFMPLATIFFGYVESLLIGLVVSSLSLVVRLSATKSASAVRTVQTGDKLISNTWRHRDEGAYLFASGKRRLIFIAQGLLSFANAPQLLDVTKGSLLAATKDHNNVLAGTAASSMTHPESAKQTPPPPVVVVIRCALVASLDYAAAHAFCELRQLCDDARARIIVSELDQRSLNTLRRLGFFDDNPDVDRTDEDDDGVNDAESKRPDVKRAKQPPLHFTDFQSALKAAEDAHLEQFVSSRLANESVDLPIYPRKSSAVIRACLHELSLHSSDVLDSVVPVLADLFTRRTVSAGTIIWRAGDQPDSGIVIVASGTLHMQRQHSRHGNPTGNTTIVEVATALSLLGHLSTFSGSKRHATLIASTMCDILELSRSRLIELRKVNPEAALILADAALARSYDEYEHYVAQSAM